MPADRFFIEGVHATGDIVDIRGSDARKIVSVLRKHTGDALEIIDSAATLFRAELEVDGAQVRARLRAGDSSASSDAPRLTIAQGIPKGQKMDFVVEKLTELGVAAIVPFESERSVVTGAGSNKVERWRRLAKSSAQQCGRRDVPHIADPLRIADVIELFGSFDCVLFPWELAPRDAGPGSIQIARLIKGSHNILAIIGPEGGFTHAEAAAARDHGAHLLSLGERILRSETAGLVVAALVQFSQS